MESVSNSFLHSNKDVLKKSVVRAVVEHLQLRGYDAELLVPEENDISLEERVRRANRITCQIGHPVQETFLVSIHAFDVGPSCPRSHGWLRRPKGTGYTDAKD